MLRRSALALALLPVLAAGPGRAGEAGARKGGGLSFLELPTLTATVFKPSGRRGVLTVASGLDVADARLRVRATGLQPRLVDAYASFLRAYAGGLRPGAAPDPAAISAAMQKATDAVLGKKGARVLLGTVMIN
jgi:hypothetical protein